MHFRRRPITLDCLERRQSYRANPFLSALSENADRLGVKIGIHDIERGQFIQSQTATVKQFQNRGIAQRHPGWSSGLFFHTQWGGKKLRSEERRVGKGWRS